MGPSVQIINSCGRVRCVCMYMYIYTIREYESYKRRDRVIEKGAKQCLGSGVKRQLSQIEV